MGISFKYWRRQLTFISPEQTLRRVMNCLEEEKPGAYLRFGRSDIDTALGIQKPGEELSESLVLEIRKSFLFSGKNIFKALHVECPALDLPFQNRMGEISNREALDRLNAVGPCFLDWPIYSYTALAYDGFEQPDLLQQFFEVLKACGPILVFKEEEAREATLAKLAPKLLIAVTAVDIYKRIDWLEDEILRLSASITNDFPVVVLALGTAGRVLAKRLMNRGFPGFLLDLDNLQEVAFEARLGVSRFRTLTRSRSRTLDKPSVGSGSTSDEKLSVRWEGPFLGHYSYSIINRELCYRLGLNEKIELSIRPSDTPFAIDHFNPAKSAGFHSIIDRVTRPLGRAAQIHIGNHAQHPFLPPVEGRWVVIQPWDYMSLPVR